MGLLLVGIVAESFDLLVRSVGVYYRMAVRLVVDAVAAVVVAQVVTLKMLNYHCLD